MTTRSDEVSCKKEDIEEELKATQLEEDKGEEGGGGSVPSSRRRGRGSMRGNILRKSTGEEGRRGGENASGRRGSNKGPERNGS